MQKMRVVELIMALSGRRMSMNSTSLALFAALSIARPKLYWGISHGDRNRSTMTSYLQLDVKDLEASAQLISEIFPCMSLGQFDKVQYEGFHWSFFDAVLVWRHGNSVSVKIKEDDTKIGDSVGRGPSVKCDMNSAREAL